MAGLNAGGTDVDCSVDVAVRNEAEVDASSSTAAQMKKGVAVGPCKSCICPSASLGSTDADACSFW